MFSTRRDFHAFYDHLTSHIVPGPRSLSYLTALLLTFGALLVPPWILSHRQIQWVVVPIIYSIQIYVWTRHDSFDVISMNAALTTFMLLGWYDVRRDFKYIRWVGLHEEGAKISHHQRGKVNEEKVASVTASIRLKSDQSRQYTLESYPSSFIPRVKWTVILFSSLRLTNWRIGAASHDSRQPCRIRSFKSFTTTTLWHTLFCYVLLDLTSSQIAESHWEHVSGNSSYNSWVSRGVHAICLMGHFYAGLALYNGLIPHLFSIGLAFIAPSLKYNHMVSPLLWPDHFGPFSSIYSSSHPIQNRGLRAFWGTFWHQNMRHITSTPGVALASMVGLRSKSRIRYMIIVASGFFWSGIVHMGVVPPKPLGTSLSSWQMRIRVACFFWCQTLGIGVEQLVDYLMEMIRRKQKSSSDVLKKPSDQRVGAVSRLAHNHGRSMMLLEQSCILLWTASFLTISAWLTVLPVGSEMGWWKLRLVPVSFFGVYLNRRW